MAQSGNGRGNGKGNGKKPATGKRTGRPSKLTPELQECICKKLLLGMYLESAAAAAGVTRQTFQTWLKLGGKGEQPYKDFLDAVEKAMGESEERDLATIDEAAKKQWQAAAWRLERKYPNKWGRHERTTLDGNVTLNVSIVHHDYEEQLTKGDDAD